jgi:hypothetical protein
LAPPIAPRALPAVTPPRHHTLAWRRDTGKIAAEASLDGVYVIRTCVGKQDMGPADVITAYKNLSHVERDFAVIKVDDLDLRPIYCYLAKRVRAHVLLCMLAAHLVWHLRQALAPLTFTDEDIPQRADPVAPTQRSDRAKSKDRDKLSGRSPFLYGTPVQERPIPTTTRDEDPKPALSFALRAPTCLTWQDDRSASQDVGAFCARPRQRAIPLDELARRKGVRPIESDEELEESLAMFLQLAGRTSVNGGTVSVDRLIQALWGGHASLTASGPASRVE